MNQAMSKQDVLIEIGTEELPPKSLFTLARAFSDGVLKGLESAGVEHGASRWYATPRRLALSIDALAARQPDQLIRRQGPSLANAYGADGHPTRAALGFAASCGVSLDDLQQVDGPKGKVLQYEATRPGEDSVQLLPGIVRAALDGLPIARRMRWGAGTQEFVRPAHWVVMLFGSDVVEADILGLQAGRETRGHRFHGPQRLTIGTPPDYIHLLKTQAHVIADVDERRDSIRQQVNALAESLGGHAVIEPALLDEVTALVEWPVAIAGHFDEKYLQLPPEVPIATMQDHQRYFPVRSSEGALMNSFITVANIDSRDPDKVRDGNQRVVSPRLADAAFFWNSDLNTRLEARSDALRAVTFQAKLGSLYDKSQRVSALASKIASLIGGEVALAERAAQLCKCDLLSDMVGEFPELQGLMGKYYAQHDGEHADVASALEEQYRPRFAGDALPHTRTGIALAIADKLDTITGIFSIGQKPTGTRDPFGLRRAALGILRTLVEHQLDVDLRQLISATVQLQPVNAGADVHNDIWTYFLERMRASYLEEGSSQRITTEMFDAVVTSNPHSPLDIDIRLKALVRFLELPEAASLAAANKRIANILRKAEEVSGVVDTKKLTENAERSLFDHVLSMERVVNPMFARREYTGALTQLAGLREDVDRFFDTVMVMAPEADIRANRLGLLARLRGLFLQVADLSQLPG